MKPGAAVLGVVGACLLALVVWLVVRDARPDVATFQKTQGTVGRDHVGREQQWEEARVKDVLALGDAARTGPSSLAELVLKNRTTVALGEETVVRFSAKRAEHAQLSVETGLAEIESADEALTFETAEGLVRLDRRSRAKLQHIDGETRLEIVLGRAELDWGADAPRTADRGAVVVKGKAAASTAKPSDVAALSAAAPRTPETVPEVDQATLPVVVEVRGRGVSVRSVGQKRARPLRAGVHPVTSGDRVVVSRGSSLELRRGSERVSAEGPSMLVVGGKDGALATALAGRMRASSVERVLRVVVPGGVIVAHADANGPSEGSLDVSKKRTEVRVVRGTIELEGPVVDLVLAAGERGSLLASGVTKRAEAAPIATDVSVRAGESATVHDPKPPTALAFAVGDACADNVAVLELASRGKPFEEQSRGPGRVTARLLEGENRYRIHCVGEKGEIGPAVASGRLVVRRDAATQQLPKRAPENSIDLDGRKYTVTYQSRLPRIEVRVPGGVSSVTWEHTGGKEVRSSNDGKVVFAPGDLPEGEHRFSAGSKATPGTAHGTAQVTTLRLVYDNATPAAYLTDAAVIAADGTGRVTLKGAVLEGSSVSVDGVATELDSSNRFAASKIASNVERGVAVRVSHPRLGVHYYVRRVQGREQAP